MAYFIYDGKSSNDFGLHITNKIKLPISERDIDFEEIEGRHGAMAFDAGRYKPVEVTFPCAIEPIRGASIEDMAHRIVAWLRKDIGYKRLIYSREPGYFWMGMHYERMDIEQIAGLFGEVNIAFKCHPLRYAVDGMRFVEMQNGEALHNRESEPALPIVHLKGKGDIALKLNTQTLNFKGLDGEIVIDCESYIITGPNDENLSHKVYSYPLPHLVSGITKVSWTGNVESLKIMPRWWRL